MNQKSLFTLVCAFILITAQNFNAQVYSPAPFSDGFETGSLGPSWTTFSSLAVGGNTVIQTGTLTWSAQTAYSHTGNYFLGMHYPTGGAYNLNQSNLHLDLSGGANLRFGFWWSEWNDESEIEDGVFISDDGGATFVKVLDLPGTSYADLVYTHFDMSLDSINTVHGLSFTNAYVIRFQQYDNYYLAGGNDGFLIDDVEVYTACSNTSNSIATSVCSSYTTPSGNATYTTSGIYADTILNVAGCDSIITIDLSVNASSSTINETTCDSYVAPDSAVYTTSGQYTAIIPNAAGCDSVITIDLIINTTTSDTLVESVCDSYTAPDSNVYTTSGIYSSIFQNAAGCDSVIVVDLTISNSTSSTIIESVLDSYTAPGGAVYTATGTYMDTIANAAGCDSIITIDLTVNYTGISEYGMNVLSIYPNPSNGLITINGLDAFQEIFAICVLNTSGQVVKQVSIVESQIDLYDLSSGVYLLEVHADQSIQRVRIIRK